MNLDNQTEYNTRILKSVMCAVHAAEPRRLKSWSTLQVRIGYANRSCAPYTGQAMQDGSSCVLSIPQPGTVYYSPQSSGDQGDWHDLGHSALGIPEFAALWRHQLWHLYGLKHKAFTREIRHGDVGCIAHVDLSAHPGALLTTAA